LINLTRKKNEDEIKEEKNEIKESYTDDEAEIKKIKLGENDNEFTELKQKFDVIVAENKKENEAAKLVSEICYLIWQNLNIEKDKFEKGVVLTDLNKNPFENYSSLSNVLANFVNKLIESAEPYLGTLSKLQNKGELKTSNLSSKLQWIFNIAKFCKNKQEGGSLYTNEQIIEYFKKTFDS